MTARPAHEPHAGHWIAFYTLADDHGHERKTYLRRLPNSWSVFRDDALRFDTRDEAERHVRQLRGRMIGQHTGAEKVGWEGAFR
jgi:hypothetical protein